MTTTAISREWFTTYCQNAAANVLDKNGKIRFTYEQLKSSLDAISEDRPDGIDDSIDALCENIIQLCDSRHGKTEGKKSLLLLTLLNIHAAYLMLSGLWKEEPIQSSGTDEYGFEIF